MAVLAAPRHNVSLHSIAVQPRRAAGVPRRSIVSVASAHEASTARIIVQGLHGLDVTDAIKQQVPRCPGDSAAVAGRARRRRFERVFAVLSLLCRR